MMRAIVNNVPLEIICDLVGITIDIQSDGGMHLSEAAAEMRQSKPKTFENAGTRDEKKKTAGGVFLTLLKKDPRVTTEMRRKVFKVPESEAKRQQKYTTSLIDAMSLTCEDYARTELSKAVAEIVSDERMVDSNNQPLVLVYQTSLFQGQMQIE